MPRQMHGYDRARKTAKPTTNHSMRTIFRTLLILLLLTGIGVAIYFPAAAYWKERNRVRYRLQPVERGDITLFVNATGTVEPVQRVSVGAFVSGPVAELLVDFNDHVVKNQLLARIDPRLYQSMVVRDKALLKTREAEVLRADARLQQAINEEKRSLELRRANPTFVSQTEIDQLQFTRMAQAAELEVTKMAVEQAQANLDNSQANLAYTEIRAPVDGIVIDRKIDAGQTLAAQFQTPELFVVAPQMDATMHIYASVDEADIGLVREAQKKHQSVRFTVDAYPERMFDRGKILEVRFSSTELQNVVTYPVIVETPNEDMQLMPGMTADLSFQIDQHKVVIKIPNAALRFYPPNLKRVHPSDRKILEGADWAASTAESTNEIQNQSALERVEIHASRNQRHVWVEAGELLRARPVVVGISDSRFTEMLSGDLKAGDLLVVGEQPKQ